MNGFDRKYIPLSTFHRTQKRIRKKSSEKQIIGGTPIVTAMEDVLIGSH